MKVNPRRPIHNGKTNSSAVGRTEVDDPEDRPNSSQSFHTEPGSDNDDHDTHHSESNEYDISTASHSPKTKQYRLKQSADSGIYNNYSCESRSPKTYSCKPGEKPIPKTSQSHNRLQNGQNLSYIFFLIVTVAVLIAGIYKFNVKPTSTEETLCSFQEMQKKFPEQNSKVWNHLRVGLESILKKRVETPAVYLFVHEGGQRVKQIIRDIAGYSSKCFGQNMQPIEMDVDDFNSEETLVDYGYAIKKFKEKIQNGKVILIANLNEIPATAARALHSICDTVSPIAPDIVVFLTLTVNNISGGNIESITEDALNNLWGKHLKYNEVDALITRVTDQVIALQS